MSPRGTLITAPLLLLASCSTVPPAPPAYAPPPIARSGSCPIIASSEWHAWVDAMPGPGAHPTLIVTGKASFPTGGWQVVWRDSRVLESYPVQIHVEIDALPPRQSAIQAVVTQDVRGSWPSDQQVGSVTISCRGRTLARIAPVETAL